MKFNQIAKKGKASLPESEFYVHILHLEKQVDLAVKPSFRAYIQVLVFAILLAIIIAVAFDVLNNTTKPSQRLEPLPIAAHIHSNPTHKQDPKELFYLNYYLDHYKKAVPYFDKISNPNQIDSLYCGINYLMLNFNQKSYEILCNLDFRENPSLYESHLYYLGVSAWYSNHKQEATSLFCKLYRLNSGYTKKFDPSHM